MAAPLRGCPGNHARVEAGPSRAAFLKGAAKMHITYCPPKCTLKGHTGGGGGGGGPPGPRAWALCTLEVGLQKRWPGPGGMRLTYIRPPFRLRIWPEWAKLAHKEIYEYPFYGHPRLGVFGQHCTVKSSAVIAYSETLPAPLPSWLWRQARPARRLPAS
jgi:hypothetical protein